MRVIRMRKGKVGGIRYESRSAHLPTSSLSEPGKRSEDRADLCLDCSFFPSASTRYSFLHLSGLGRALWVNSGDDSAQRAFPVNCTTKGVPSKYGRGVFPHAWPDLGRWVSNTDSYTHKLFSFSRRTMTQGSRGTKGEPVRRKQSVVEFTPRLIWWSMEKYISQRLIHGLRFRLPTSSSQSNIAGHNGKPRALREFYPIQWPAIYASKETQTGHSIKKRND